MTEFTVCRTLDTHPALRYCLLLDDMRIAGGKPDYRGDNILISWRTKETYGPVDAIKSENKQLTDEKAALERRIDELCQENEQLRAEQAHWELGNCPSCPNVMSLQEEMTENAKLRELASILCFCMQVHKQCDDCKLNGAKGELAHDPLCACDGLHEILRELGIEVDG